MKLAHLIALTRPHIFFPLLVFYINGIYTSDGQFSWIDVALLYIVHSFAMIVNQISDIDTDRYNRKVLILGNVVSLKEAYRLAFILLLLVCFCSIIIEQYLLLVLVLLSIAYYYTKGIPILDMITNVLGYTIVFIIGSGGFNNHVFTFALAMASGYISTSIPDIQGDKLAGKITTCVLLGRKRCIFLNLFLLVLTCISALLTHDHHVLLASLLNILLLGKPKIGIIVAMLVVFVFPAFAVPQAIPLAFACLMYPAVYYRLVFGRNLV